MNRIFVGAVIVGFAVGLPAQQQKTQEELQAQRAEKLAKEVFQRAPWIGDYDRARAEAKKQGKLLLAYFTRSYAP